MDSLIEVRFHGMPANPSIEGAVQRWVTRLEPFAGHGVRDCHVVIEPWSFHRTRVGVTIALARDVPATATAIHGDAYVAVYDAFRTLRRKLLDRGDASAPSAHGA